MWRSPNRNTPAFWRNVGRRLFTVFCYPEAKICVCVGRPGATHNLSEFWPIIGAITSILRLRCIYPIYDDNNVFFPFAAVDYGTYLWSPWVLTERCAGPANLCAGANLQMLLHCCSCISFRHISLSKIPFSVTEPFNFLLHWLNIPTRINEASAYVICGIRHPVWCLLLAISKLHSCCPKVELIMEH